MWDSLKDNTPVLKLYILYVFGLALVSPLLSPCLPAYAQGVLGQGLLRIDPTGRSGDLPPFLREEEPAPAAPQPILPPLPLLPPLPQKPAAHLAVTRTFVKDIQLTGNTVFSSEELAEVTNPYENKELTAEDLETLRLDPACSRLGPP